MAGTSFDWSVILKQIVAKRKVEVEAGNVAAKAAYKDSCEQWIYTNTISRDRVMNVGFVPSPLPPLPKRQAVDEVSGAIVDLGLFPDLGPPSLPPFVVAETGGSIAALSVDKMDVLLALFQMLQADIEAIRAKVGA